MDQSHHHQHHQHHQQHHQGHHLGNDFDSSGSYLQPSSGHLDLSGGQSSGQGMGAGSMGHTKMVFQWLTGATVLFKNWTTSTVVGLASAMFVAALLGAGYEWLKNWLAEWDKTQCYIYTMPRWKRTCVRVFRSAMHALTAAVSYLQMLLAMTFDLRIFVAIILSSGLGYFVLGPSFRQRAAEREIMKKRRDLLNGNDCAKSAECKDRFIEEGRKARKERNCGGGGDGDRDGDEAETELL